MYAYNAYVVTGYPSTTIAVPFPYLEKAHVNFTIAGVPLNGADAVWADPQTITVPSMSVGTAVIVQRITPSSELLVTIQSSLFNAGSINKGLKQVLYFIQETADRITNFAAGTGFLPRDGSLAMTGALPLVASEPTLGVHATSKAYVDALVAAAVAGLAGLAGPTFTGDPKAPTPTLGDNDTSLATTAFVQQAVGQGPLAGFVNLLINPDGRFNERAPATNADDTYGHDRWIALTQSNAIAVSSVADAEDGMPSMWRLTQSNASAQRMGYSQILEANNSKHLRGKQVTLSGRIRASASQAIRYAILEWTGTADSVTSDVVSSWTNAAFTAGQFFLGSNLTVSAVGSITPGAGTLTSISLSATLSSALNNLIVFIWTEGTAVQNFTLDGAVQLELGAVPSRLERRPIGIEELLCRRYFQRLGGLNVFEIVANGNIISTTQAKLLVPLVPSMRTTPTPALIGAAGNWGVIHVSDTTTAVTAVSISASTARNMTLTVTVASGLTAGQACRFGANNTLSARIDVEAEL